MMMEQGDVVVVRSLSGIPPEVGIYQKTVGRWVTVFVDDGDRGRLIDVDLARVEPCPKPAKA